ncbi:hypothetical protein [Chitinophaga niabensis]|uniref:Uncharacterized protein n=1 Tax=Chitinophaga niabensis TaxID=536979 RepID=A0A1N6E3J3_9BACT|nr:hypothetical protein [Chitinophaga niabensis]SIN77600.1 hypothetical protein SAMN04488055_1277 [Chitinophaga niabensis]
MISYFTRLRLVALVFLIAFYSSCQQHSHELIPNETYQYAEEVKSYLNSQRYVVPGLGNEFGDSLFRQLDVSGIKKISWKNSELIIAPLKSNNPNRSAKVLLEFKNNKPVGGTLIEVNATGAGDKAGDQLQNFLNKKPLNFTGRFKATSLSNGGHELLSYTLQKGKLLRAEIVQPDRSRNALAKAGVPDQLAAVGDPTGNCVTWVRVYYNPETGEIYETLYLYTVCDGGGGGSGTGNETQYEYQQQDLCAKARSLKDDTVFISKLALLKYAAQNMNYEAAWVHTNQPANGGWNLFTGQPDQHHIQMNMNNFSDNSVQGMMHNHFAGGFSIFSVSDLRAMYDLLRYNKVENPANFSFTVITNQGTTYTLGIENVQRFRDFGNNWLNNDVNAVLLENRYTLQYGISNDNLPADNQEKFMNLLADSNTGLTFYKGNFSSLDSWRPIVRDGNNEFVIIPCR